MRPEVSVILPFHKNASTLQAAIQSIIEQNFKDWELILVDNTAYPESRILAEKYQNNNPRIRLIHEYNQGIAFALNSGIRVSAAGLIARMDADDIAHPDRLEKQVEYLKKYPLIDVVSCRCKVPVMNEWNNEGYRFYAEWQNNIITPEDHLLTRFTESPLAHPTVVFRKKLIEKYGYYNRGSLPEDYELWLRWMDKGIHFYKLPEYLLEWNDSPERLSRTHTHYSDDAFWQVKCHYLAKYLKDSGIIKNRKVIICGTSAEIRKKSSEIEQQGIPVYAHTDVKTPNSGNLKFIAYNEVCDPDEFFIINLIRKRNAGQDIKDYYSKFGFENGRDLILAG